MSVLFRKPARRILALPIVRTYDQLIHRVIDNAEIMAKHLAENFVLLGGFASQAFAKLPFNH